MKISQKRLAAEQELRKRIANGFYKIGEMLPSEPNLAKEFHIARETLRSICSQLIDEKLLVKIPRQGTYVKTGASRLGHKIFYLLPHENFLSDVRLETVDEATVFKAAQTAAQGFTERVPGEMKKLCTLLVVMFYAHGASRIRDKAVELLSTLN